METIKKIITIVVFGAIFVSCESRTYDEIGGYVENPTYNKDIKPIIDNKCVTCHFANNQDFISDLSNYNLVKDSFVFGSSLEYINDGTMPKNSSKLSNATLKLINKWAADGFPEN